MPHRKTFKPMPVLGAFVVLTALAALVGSAERDQRLRKEPAYRSRAPKYHLLAFGPQAETRVWLVLDGEVLYVDRNGNGDLTEEPERVTGDGNVFQVGDIPARDSRTRYAQLKVQRLDPTRPGQGLRCVVFVEVPGKYRQFGVVSFAGRPQDASVLHFDGPLTMGLIDPAGQVFARGDKATELTAWIGTPVLGKEKGDAACVEHGQGVPTDVHPVAEIEFPGQDAGARPITVKAVLSQRC